MCWEDVFGTTDREVVAVDEKLNEKKTLKTFVYMFSRRLYAVPL